MQLDNVVTKSSSHDIADGVGSDDGSSVQSHSTFSDPELMGKHKEFEPFFGRAMIVVFGARPSLGVANMCCKCCVRPTLMLNANLSEDMHCTVQVHVLQDVGLQASSCTVPPLCMWISM